MLGDAGGACDASETAGSGGRAPEAALDMLESIWETFGKIRFSIFLHRNFIFHPPPQPAGVWWDDHQSASEAHVGGACDAPETAGGRGKAPETSLIMLE